jgi:hypothetical protein
MKSVLLMAGAFIVFMASAITTPVMAAQEDVEEACISKADEMQIADDKYDDFIQQCIATAAPKDE